MGSPLQGHTSLVWSVAFSSDGRHIVSGSSDKTIRLWDVQTGSQVGNPLQGHTSLVRSVAFSPDGRHIVSGSDGCTIRLWDAQTGGQVRTPLLEGHTDSVNSVTFSPNGRHIVSGSSDKTIQLWNAQTGSQVGNPLQGHTGSVISVAISPDGRHIVSGLNDCTIQLWDAQIEGQVRNPTLFSTNVVGLPLSVAFQWPDRRNTMPGSKNQNLQFLWEEQINGETMERSLQNKWLAPIHFSSSTRCTLQSLLFALSNMIEVSQHLVYLQDDGWIVGPNKELLLWIPSSYHSPFHYTSQRRQYIPGIPKLDLRRMAHGSAWCKCYLPSNTS